MLDDPSIPKYELSGGTLRVTGDLRSGDERDFERALEDLLATEAKALVIDLCAVAYVASTYVRHVALTMIRAKDEGRPVTIRAGKRVVRVLEMGGVNKLATLMITNGEPPGR